MADLRPVGVPVDGLALDLHLDGADLDRKLTALRAMATQTGDLVASVRPDAFAALVADETFIEATRRYPRLDRQEALASPGTRAPVGLPSTASE